MQGQFPLDQKISTPKSKDGASPPLLLSNRKNRVEYNKDVS